MPRKGSTRRQSAQAARGGSRKIRYAVVGLGYIAQVAVLPAFKNARRNSVLKAFVSDDPRKTRALGKRYGVDLHYDPDHYDDCLESGEIDAVYIALPNELHREYAVRAARAGVHVLCEKPLAVTEEDCEEMIRAAEKHNVRLMTAYRLHFNRANLQTAEIARAGKLGKIRFFDSEFSMQVKEGDIRLQKGGGGTLYDLGVYCINAARYLFRDEPVEVFAFQANSGEKRFRDVDEMSGAVLKFPEERLATFVTSFGGGDVAEYRIVGTKGWLRLENAYEYAKAMRQIVSVGGRTRTRAYPKGDQFAPELLHFSDCVSKGTDPEPSGLEGLIDVSIVRALYRSAEIGKPVSYSGPRRHRRPTLEQAIQRPPVQEPELVHTSSPSKE